MLFFFQAEDGIRDIGVTGVQTCALPILIPRVHDRYGKERSALVAAFPTFRSRGAIRELGKVLGLPAGELERVARGAEPGSVKRRVGEEGRSRGSPSH